MNALNITTDNFDSSNKFSVQVQGSRVNRICHLKRFGDRLEVCQGSTVLKDTYSQAETDFQTRINMSKPLVNGDVVVVEGKEYTLKVRGNYSDLGYLVAN